MSSTKNRSNAEGTECRNLNSIRQLKSMFSLLWKKSILKQQSSCEVPDVAPSTSDDDQLSPTASMEAATATMMTTACCESPPSTPPALKPRASIHEIRNQLGIPNLLPLSNTQVSMTAGGLPVLPPRIQVANGLSPQVSSSSFYSKSSQSSNRVASSPNLAAPTTAVGALLAQSQPSMKSVSFFPENDDYQRYHPVLPPRKAWLHEDSIDEVQYQRLEDHMDSRIDDYDHSSYDNHTWTNQSDTSFSSQTGLVDEKPRRYNFDPILNLNVSAISGNMTDQSSLERDDEDMGNELLIRKRYNQKSQKERLILDCVERMMENLPLMQLLGASNTQTPFDVNGDGLLLGLTERNRGQVQKHLESILRELDTARPEEFFMSPSQIEEFGETHSKLRHALQFVLQALQLEPSDAWELKHEIQVSLGLATLPDSPSETIRGGDTSLFTLPEESTTPHTSNVSIATTITSKPLTPEKQESLLQRTMEKISAHLHKLSQACETLADPKVTAQTIIRSTEEMKKIYMSIMTLENKELMVVADAFYLAMPLIRTVSVEGEDDFNPSVAPPVVPPPPFTSVNLLDTFEYHVQTDTFNQGNENLDDDAKHSSIDQEEDDLRRMVGSNDYDCNDTRDDVPDTDEEERSACHEFYHSHSQPSHLMCKT